MKIPKFAAPDSEKMPDFPKRMKRLTAQALAAFALIGTSFAFFMQTLSNSIVTAIHETAKHDSHIANVAGFDRLAFLYFFIAAIVALGALFFGLISIQAIQIQVEQTQWVAEHQGGQP